MRKIINILSLFLLVSLGFFSCKKKEDDKPVDMGYNYFPDQVGRYVVYDVDSIHYDDFNMDLVTHISPAIEYKFQIKEKIESIFTDNQNRPTIRLERYVKYFDQAVPYTQMTWTLRNVWTENKTLRTAEKVEDNVRFVKLVFPVTANQSWNGNAQNTSSEMTYSYSSIDQPLQLGLLAFDSVLQVTQQDETTIISKHYSIEKYSRKAGLIYKDSIHVESQPGPTWPIDTINSFLAKPILSRVTRGSRCTMTAVYYGTE